MHLSAQKIGATKTKKSDCHIFDSLTFSNKQKNIYIKFAAPKFPQYYLMCLSMVVKTISSKYEY